MAPLNRDYDRDFGFRGNTNFSDRDAERGWGDRLSSSARRGWNQLTHPASGSYDRNLGFRGGSSGYDRDLGFRGTSSSYDRDLGFRGGFSNYDRDFGFRGGSSNYDRDLGFRSGSPYGSTGYISGGARGYGSDYSRDFTSIYDRGFKSRAETEGGDPFNDRGSHTPIRVIRGQHPRYGRDYSSNPVSYEPNDFRSGYRNRSNAPLPYDRGFRGMDRGYDRGWF